MLTSAPKPAFSVEKLAGNITVFRMGVHKKDLHFWRRREVVEWLIKAGACYRRLVKTGGYDLVHAFFGFPSGWLCHRTAKRLPYIISLRGSDVPGENARLKLDYKILGPLVFRPIWKKASALVACSEGLKLRALQFLPSAQIEVIPNGVDLEAFHPADPKVPEGGRRSEALRLLTVGRLSATKRLPLLIEAVDRLNRDGCKAHLTVVGGGALEAEFRRLLGAGNLRDVVTLTGRRSAKYMPKIYRRHDIFVSASLQEGMSNAMLEAMASGLPIVTTRCEGVDELIAGNGVVIGDAQPTALAAAIRKLADDHKTRHTMSVTARKRAEDFSWAGVAESYLQLYAKVK